MGYFLNNSLSFILIIIFFLPYIPDSRLRVDVIILYTLFALYFFIHTERSPFEKKLYLVLFLSGLWCFLRLFTGFFENFMQHVITWTNMNFALFTLSAFLIAKQWCIKNRKLFAVIVLFIAIPINIIALVQWLFPANPINQVIFRLYGGTLSRGYYGIGYYIYNAEFLSAAQRYTSIFNGMHVLALFNIMSLCLTPAIITDSSLPKRQKIIAYISVMFCITGGILTASKTFYLGAFCAISCFTFVSKRVIEFVIGITILLLGFWLNASILGTSYLASAERMFATVYTLDVGTILDSRYGSTGYLTPTITSIIDDVSIMIFGAGKNSVDYILADSLYIPPIVVGGIILLILYILPILMLLRENFRTITLDTYSASFFSAHVAFLLVGIGTPSYQVGRVAPLLFLLNLCFLKAPEK